MAGERDAGEFPAVTGSEQPQQHDDEGAQRNGKGGTNRTGAGNRQRAGQGGQAYTCLRSTAGVAWLRTSRSIPPPMPVIRPRKMQKKALSPKAGTDSILHPNSGKNPQPGRVEKIQRGLIDKRDGRQGAAGGNTSRRPRKRPVARWLPR